MSDTAFDPLKPARVRTRHLAQFKREGRPITALTSYDALTAGIFDEAGIDVLLVGDSAGNTVLGHESTLSITLDELTSLTGAVARGAERALVVADLPFGAYESSPAQAFASAAQLMRQGAQAVKLEGGRRSADKIAHLSENGIPVMGHLGFTPQSEHALGGFVVQGRGASAEALIEDAREVQRAGAFAVVLEMVPRDLAARITAELSIPTIGIGAGSGCDGQILVWQDLAGLRGGRRLTFVREYARLRETLVEAARQYGADVRSREFPSLAESFGDVR